MVADIIDPPVSKDTEDFTRAYAQAFNLVAGRMGLRRKPGLFDTHGCWYFSSIGQLDELNERVRAVLEASA